MSMYGNYVGRLVTRQSRQAPRTIDQFPNKLNFKARMSRHKFSFKNPTPGKMVVLPQVDELSKIRHKEGKILPTILDEEVKGIITMAPFRRLLAIGDQMTELIRYERIEGNRVNLQDVRIYTELLLQIAIANGDRHRPTMELVDFYIKDKDLIPKIFQVLVPRFVGGTASHGGPSSDMSPSPTSLSLPTRFTDFYNLPPENMRYIRQEHNRQIVMRGVLELRGHPWPSVVPRRRDRSGLITNVLLRAAKASKEEAKRKKAIESVKAKVGAVTESLESNRPAAASVAIASATDNPYLKYHEKKGEEENDSDEWMDEPFESEVDDTDLDLKLKNLDLNL